MAGVMAMPNSDQEWKAESDADAMATVEAMRGDDARIERARVAAAKILERIEENAEDQQERAVAMRKIAKGKVFNYNVIQK